MLSALQPLIGPAVTGHPSPPGPPRQTAGLVFERLLASSVEPAAVADRPLLAARPAQRDADTAGAAAEPGDHRGDDDSVPQRVDQQQDDTRAPLPAGSATSAAATAEPAGEADAGAATGAPGVRHAAAAVTSAPAEPTAAGLSDTLLAADPLAPAAAPDDMTTPAAALGPGSTGVPSSDARSASLAPSLPPAMAVPAEANRPVAPPSLATASHPPGGSSAAAATDGAGRAATAPNAPGPAGAAGSAAAGATTTAAMPEEPAPAAAPTAPAASSGAAPPAADGGTAAITTAAAPSDTGGSDAGNGGVDSRGFGNGGAGDGAAAAGSVRSVRDPGGAPAASPVQQVAMSIIRAARNGVSRIQIELSPEHLGRLDIRLEINKDHRLAVVVLADNAETLTLLRQDARALHDALAAGGFSTDGGGLSFGLRDQGQSPAGGGAGQPAAPPLTLAAADAAADEAPRPPGQPAADRLDIRA